MTDIKPDPTHGWVSGWVIPGRLELVYSIADNTARLQRFSIGSRYWCSPRHSLPERGEWQKLVTYYELLSPLSGMLVLVAAKRGLIVACCTLLCTGSEITVGQWEVLNGS